MSLAPGARIGSYEILRPLGAGGMGEVYQARDTRLDRIVAIKVSQQAFTSRFEREARAIAALNHPHICVLYDIGRHEPPAGTGDVIEYLVMEYVEGETLADRLARGGASAPLPLADAINYAVQIADALDKAHRQGIVHRDLKPGNIMITKTGVKLLDFGLAKILTPAPEAAGLSTRLADLTSEGTILGTLQYMAPEQLEGREADARTDLFAFGAVLHEMVTGEKAFTGRSQASLIAAILEREPPAVSSLQTLAPASLDRIVATCLAKDPDDRWQTARDLGRALRWTATGQEDASARATTDSRKSSRFRWPLVAAGLAVGVLAGAGVASRWLRPQVVARSPTRFIIELPDSTLGAGGFGNSLAAISRDGRQIVYRGGRSPNTVLYRRLLGDTEGFKIRGHRRRDQSVLLIGRRVDRFFCQ